MIEAPKFGFLVRWITGHIGLDDMQHLCAQASSDAQQLRRGASEDEAEAADTLDLFWQTASSDPLISGQLVAGLVLVRIGDVVDQDQHEAEAAGEVIDEPEEAGDGLVISPAQIRKLIALGQALGMIRRDGTFTSAWVNELKPYDANRNEIPSFEKAERLIEHLSVLLERRATSR